MWECHIHADHHVKARRPDLVIVNEREKTCQIIDVFIPVDTAVREKEKEKMKKYQDLAREVGKMWRVKVKVLPVVIGALGTVPRIL